MIGNSKSTSEGSNRPAATTAGKAFMARLAADPGLRPRRSLREVVADAVARGVLPPADVMAAALRRL